MHPSEYEKYVIEIIAMKIGEEKIWQKIPYEYIDIAARRIKDAVDAAENVLSYGEERE